MLLALFAMCFVCGIAKSCVSAIGRSLSPSSSSPSTQLSSTQILPTFRTTSPSSHIPLPTFTTPRQSTTPAKHPHWDGDGVWLRDYQEEVGDCGGTSSYWVVQPGESDGMLALKQGCFPLNWADQITAHCKAARLANGWCAAWDPGKIMSHYGVLGDLRVVVITQACLDRADLPAFHEGPLHNDCVVSRR